MLVRILLTLALCSPLAAAQESTRPAQFDPATLSGRTVTLHPSGVSFDVPSRWIAWYEKSHNNLHLAKGEVESVHFGHGEWSTEYAEVVNSGLPFEDCMAQVSGDGWGREATSFVDVHLRIYLTKIPEKRIQELVSEESFSTAKKVGDNASLLPSVTEGPWTRLSVVYSVFYHDYGGRARVDFYTREYKGQTVVLVFMWCDSNNARAAGEIASIVHSFRFPHEQQQ